MAKDNKSIKIPAPLESATTGRYVTTAKDIVDEQQGKTQEVINQEEDAQIERISDEVGVRPYGVTGSLHDRINSLRDELNAKQFEVQALETDEIPTRGSDNFVRSGGIFNYMLPNAKDSTTQNYIATGPKGTYVNNGIIDDDNSNRYVSFWVLPFNAGDAIKFTGVVSDDSAYNTFYISPNSPVEYARENNGSLVGFECGNSVGSGKESFTFLVPYDNCYVLTVHNASYYTSRSFTYYYKEKNAQNIEYLKNYIEDVRTNISTLPLIQTGPSLEINYVTMRVKTASSNSYRVNYFTEPFNKGDVIHFSGTASASKAQVYFVTTQNPAEYNIDPETGVNSIVGMPVTLLYRFVGTVHNHDVVIPYDDAYILYYNHTGDWNTASRKFTYYKKGDINNWREQIDTKIDENVSILENADFQLQEKIDKKMGAIEENYTSHVTWLNCGSAASRLANTSVVTDSETGNVLVTILVNQSGSRFGMKFTNMQLGHYKVEFDCNRDLVNGAFYNAQVSDTAVDSSNYIDGSIAATHTYIDGHYTFWLNVKKAGTFYVHYANQSQKVYSVGTTFDITGFTVTKVTSDISDWEDRLDALDLKAEIVDGMQWFTRTIMGGYMAIGTAIDAREQIEEEGELIDNPEYGNEYENSHTSSAASNFVPLMGCDKFTIKYISSTNQSSEVSSEFIDKSGVVLYDSNKIPIKTLAIEQGADTSALSTLEVVRSSADNTSEMAFVRFRTGSGSTYFLNNNITLYYSYETLRAQLLNESLITFKNIAVSTSARGVYWRTGSYSGASTHWRHGYVKVEGADFVSIRGRIIDNSGSYVNYGGVVRDKEGNVLDTIYKMATISSGSYTYNIWYALPEGAYDVLWSTHSDVTSTTVYLYRKTSTWRDEIEEKINSFGDNLDNELIYNTVKKRATIEKISEATWAYYDSDAYVNAPTGETPGVGARYGLLTLLHYSDWHESIVAGNDLLSWKDAIDNYYSLLGGTKSWINDIINTGDVVENYLSNNTPNAYFNVEGLAANSLFVLGNHDQAYSSNGTRRYELFWADCGENGDGNIDTYSNVEDVRNIVKASHKFSYNHYFEGNEDVPYYESWGVTMPEGYNDENSPYYQACYWHKDYCLGYKVRKEKENDVTVTYYDPIGIRLIGLDCMYRFDGTLKTIKENDAITSFVFDNNNMIDVKDNYEGLAKTTTEQETWFYNKLMETLDPENDAYGYEVICVDHYPLDDLPAGNILDQNGCNTTSGKVLNYRTNDRVNFEFENVNTTANLSNTFWLNNRIIDSNYDYTESGRKGYGFTRGDDNNFGDILQFFQNQGGKVIAWICGHTHRDHFYYPAKYPNILTVVIDRAGEKRTNTYTRRNSLGNNTLCANFYAIDIIHGQFKIIRLGLNTNSRLEALNTLCYDYKNKKVISET